MEFLESWPCRNYVLLTSKLMKVQTLIYIMITSKGLILSTCICPFFSYPGPPLRHCSPPGAHPEVCPGDTCLPQQVWRQAPPPGPLAAQGGEFWNDIQRSVAAEGAVIAPSGWCGRSTFGRRHGAGKGRCISLLALLDTPHTVREKQKGKQRQWMIRTTTEIFWTFIFYL